MNNSQKLMRFRNTRYFNLFNRCKKILDIGCGDGYFVEFSNDKGLDCWGIDLSPKSKNKKIINGNALKLISRMENLMASLQVI